MKTSSANPESDTRSPEQQQLDAAAAEGNWSEFAVEELLSGEGASQLIEYRRNLIKEIAMDQSIAMTGIKAQPFRWKDQVFRILRCDYVGGQAQVEVVPHDDEFVSELKKRVEQDRFHHLAYYQGFGFICFPENYTQYQS